MSGLIQYIKIARIDNNGVDNTLPLESLNTLILPSGSSFKEYTILNRTRTNDYFLYYVQPPDREDIADDDKSVLNYEFTGSCLAGTNVTSTFSLYQAGISIPITESNSDNLGFYNADDDAYKFPSYPSSEIINVRFSGSITTNGSSGTTVIGVSQGNTTRDDGSIVRSNLFTPTANAGAGATTSFDIQVSIPANTISAGDYLFPLVVPPGGMGDDVNSFIFNGAKFFISSSLTNTNNFKNLVIEPYLTSKFYGEDCDVLQNNATQGIPNTLLQKVDYSTNAMNPVNFKTLISGTATNADIPQSYFEISSILNPSYNRSLVQSSDVNVYDNLARGTDFGDSINRGTYGKTPSISSLDVNIYEFEWGGGTTPEILDYGAVKLGRILQVSSPEQVKTINKSDGIYTDLILSNKSTTVGRARNYRVIVESNLYPPESVSTASVGIKNFWITSQSRGDYYQILNSNNPVNSEISMYMYPNSTAGSQPTLPQSTKILNTEWGVPTISNYALTSSNAVSYGAIEGAGTDSFIQISGSVDISKVTTDSNGFYNSGNTIKPTWATIGDQINKDLNNGEKWFITLYNEFEFPNGQGDYDFPLTTGSLSPYNEGFTDIDSKGNYATPLGYKGVFEIAGTYDEKALAGSNTFNFLLVDTFPVSARGKKIGGGVAGNSLGMLIWKARATGKNEFVLVQDSITGGVQEGAFTSRFTPSYITENFEAITKEFGTNQTG